jgi:serine/threonine-protein kinase HipA
VHRFDRVHDRDQLRPLAVEDACQVLGRWPGDKYVIPTEGASTGLARCCRAPGVAAPDLSGPVGAAGSGCCRVHARV